MATVFSFARGTHYGAGDSRNRIRLAISGTGANRQEWRFSARSSVTLSIPVRYVNEFNIQFFRKQTIEVVIGIDIWPTPSVRTKSRIYRHEENSCIWSRPFNRSHDLNDVIAAALK